MSLTVKEAHPDPHIYIYIYIYIKSKRIRGLLVQCCSPRKEGKRIHTNTFTLIAISLLTLHHIAMAAVGFKLSQPLQVKPKLLRMASNKTVTGAECCKTCFLHVLAIDVIVALKLSVRQQRSFEAACFQFAPSCNVLCRRCECK